jgi:hypothetical protein
MSRYSHKRVILTLLSTDLLAAAVEIPSRRANDVILSASSRTAQKHSKLRAINRCLRLFQNLAQPVDKSET